MILVALFPWLCGLVSLGIGYLAVGDSGWLWAFVVPVVIVAYIGSFGMVSRV